MSSIRSILTALISLALAACTASPKINVGDEPDGSVAGSGGGGGSGGFGGFGGGVDNALTAKVTEPPSEMAIEVITVSCAGECKQVLAIANGGNAPYAFAWNDGVTSDSREVCGDDGTSFSVSVSDTAITDGEFPYVGQQATARVTMQVLDCPGDGGIDAGPGSGLCLDNPSFEGTPRASDFMPFAAAPWQECLGTPDIIGAGDALRGTPPASDGVTFLGVNEEAASSSLCATLRKDEVVHLLVDLAYTNFGGPGGSLQVYGATSGPCGEDELLGQTVPTATVNTWETQCLTLQPTQDIHAITLRGRDRYVIVDNLRTTQTCP